MNIFLLDRDPAKAAKYHFDKHVVKMILESAQMLANLLPDSRYRQTHLKHPCSAWAARTIENWNWLLSLYLYLHDEWRYRYKHNKTHKSYWITEAPKPDLPSEGLTEFPQAMPETYRREDPVEAYRGYYKAEKGHLAKWTRRRKPPWW